MGHRWFAEGHSFIQLFGHVGDDDVDFHFQRLLDLLAGQAAGAALPVQHNGRVLRLPVAFRQAEQAQRIAHAGQRRIHDDDAVMGEGEQLAVAGQGQKRHVHDDEIVAYPQRVDQPACGARGVGQRLAELLLGGQDVQPFGHRQRRPLDENWVYPRRLFQRQPQARAGFAAQHQGTGAHVQVGLQEHRVALGDDAEIPGQIAAEGGGADAAAGADDTDDPAAAGGVAAEHLAGNQRREMPGHRFARHRFEQILRHPHVAGDMAVEIDVVGVADHQHPHAWLDQVRKLGQGVQRLLLVGDVDDQHFRGR